MKSKETQTHRIVILPLPVWIVVGAIYGVYQVITWLVALARTERVSQKMPPLPEQTSIQKDPELARLSWMLYSKLNAYRLSRGLPQMVWNEKLEASSLYHCNRMGRDKFAHVLPDGVDVADRVKKYGYQYSEVRENLGMVAGPSFTLEEVAHRLHDGWVHSPGHHENLVSDCEEVGIAVLKHRDSKYGWKYVATQNFGTPMRAALPRFV